MEKKKEMLIAAILFATTANAATEVKIYETGSRPGTHIPSRL